jgi:DNA polymerase III alpha subunit (gram-positive type)
MIKGYDAIKSKINEITLKGKEASNKEIELMDTLQICIRSICSWH